MLTGLRAALNAGMADLHPARKPALRRAQSEEWLLATDLPGLVDAACLQGWLAALETDGWRWSLNASWLLLDHAVPIPQTHLPLEGECACLVSLLRRHPSDTQDEAAVRMLAKACEQGPAAWENACLILHRCYAARLRLHQPLPGLLLPYLTDTNKEDVP